MEALYLILKIVLVVAVFGGVIWTSYLAYQAWQLPPTTEAHSLEKSGAASFHQAEFSTLKSEVSALAKSTAESFSWATVASGSIFAWLAKGDMENASLAAIVIWLPLALSSLLYVRAWTAYLRIAMMSVYLYGLERALGSPSMGWESTVRKKRDLLGIVNIAAWLVLLVGDAILGIVLPRYL